MSSEAEKLALRGKDWWEWLAGECLDLSTGVLSIEARDHLQAAAAIAIGGVMSYDG